MMDSCQFCGTNASVAITRRSNKNAWEIRVRLCGPCFGTKWNPSRDPFEEIEETFVPLQ
jgi:hypothetical protein